MDASTPTPETNEPQVQAPVPVVPPPPPTPKITTPIIIAAVVTVLVVSGIFYGISRFKPKETAVTPTPTPTPIATPTPIRQPSALAATFEFGQFQAAVATISAAIAAYNPQDPSLTPPTLILPLGFSR